MNVKILKIATNQLVDAEINSRQNNLPGLHEGWRFSFDKHIKKPGSSGFVLVTEETPEIIEGCLIFQMREKQIPYMAFLEIAPHNKAVPKRYDYVAGCLIAFAFQQSVMKGKNEYKALLSFDVQEENETQQTKLMALYSTKYGAVRVDQTMMFIMDEAGYALIDTYLKRQ